MINNPINEEKKEFLKREEIKTMAKDIALLRETEAQAEREKIAKIKVEEKIIPPPPAGLPVQEQKEKTTAQKPAPPVLGSSFFKKIFVRLIIGIIIILLAGFFYWFFKVRKEEARQPAEKTSAEESVVIVEEPVVIEEPIIPAQPIIIERILDLGHYLPKTARTIDTIIIHSTYNNTSQDHYNIDEIIGQFRLYRVTPHYLIDRQGVIYRLAPDKDIAYHTGVGQMPDGRRKNIINNFSLGIELIYAKTESPNEAQYLSSAQLVKELKRQYDIPPQNILGRGQVTPERKDEPWNFGKEKFEQMLVSE